MKKKSKDSPSNPFVVEVMCYRHRYLKLIDTAESFHQFVDSQFSKLLAIHKIRKSLMDSVRKSNSYGKEAMESMVKLFDLAEILENEVDWKAGDIIEAAYSLIENNDMTTGNQG